MEFDQQSHLKRLSKEEYLADDPLLDWIRRTGQSLEHRMVRFVEEENMVGAAETKVIQSDLKTIEESYITLAGRIASGNSDTVKLSREIDAVLLVNILNRLTLQGDVHDPPEWVRAAVERRSSRFRGMNDSLSDHMLRWDAALQIDVKLDDIFRAAVGQYSESESSAASSSDYYAVQQDFTKVFLGNADEKLRSYVESQMNEKGNRLVYANVIPILQSSGTGKSRTVTQLSAENLGLFVCVRDTSSASLRSQPPADQSVLNYLQEDHGIQGRFSCFKRTRRIAVWLIAMANEMADFYEEHWQKFRKEQEDDFAAFVSHAGQLLSPGKTPSSRGSTPPRKGSTSSSADQREHLLSAIDQAAVLLENKPEYNVAAFLSSRKRSEGNDHPPASQTRPSSDAAAKSRRTADATSLKRAGEIPSAIPNSAIHGIRSARASSHHAHPTGKNVDEGTARKVQPNLHELTEYSASAEFFEDDLRSAFTRLEGCFLSPEKASPSRSKPFFHLAIDECGKMGSHLSVIRRLWSTIGVSSCFLFLLDTNTQISLTYGQESVASSLRLKLGDKALLPPFINLPHDLALRQDLLNYRKVVCGQEYLSHAGLMPWLRKMGRPLLNDTWLLQPRNEQVNLMKLLDKMVQGSLSFHNIQSSVALALHRMSLILVGFQGNASNMYLKPGLEFAEDQVASYMRRLRDVTAKGEVISTVGCSEPLLSMAATFLFREDPFKNWSMTIQHVKTARTEYSLEMGTIGEEVAQILMHAAADIAAISKKRPGDTSLDYDLLHPVNLQDFLDSLFFGKDAPDTDNLNDLRRWASGYWINFTHFSISGTLFDKSSKEHALLTNRHLAMLWTRRAAIVGQRTQPGWDFVIPIYKSDSMPVGKELFRPANLSLLPVQVKNQQGGETSGAHTNIAAGTVESEDLNVHPGRATIWFDLKAPASPCEIYNEKQTSKRQIEDKPPPQVFHITAKGHKPQAINVVGSLTSEAQLIIPELLGILEGVSEPSEYDKEDEQCWTGQIPFYDSMLSINNEPATK